jgi:hypothetical protein
MHRNADPCRHGHSDSVPDHRDRGRPPSKRGFPGDDSHPDGLFRLVLAARLGADVPMRRHASALCASCCKRIALRVVPCPGTAKASAPQTLGGGPWGVALSGHAVTRQVRPSATAQRRCTAPRPPQASGRHDVAHGAAPASQVGSAPDGAACPLSLRDQTRFRGQRSTGRRTPEVGEGPRGPHSGQGGCPRGTFLVE